MGKQQLPGEDRDLLARHVATMHETLRQADPLALAASTGATYLPSGCQQGTFHLPYWGRAVTLTYPECNVRDGRTGEKLGTLDQALLAYYFRLSDGTPLAGSWISFSELPDGRFYDQAFQGYTGHELAKALGNDGAGFGRAAEHLHGRFINPEQSPGDIAFAYPVLPRVALLVVCWLGDEDFPASYRILFDAAIGHHLSTDACAILGSTLTRRLLKAYSQLREH